MFSEPATGYDPLEPGAVSGADLDGAMDVLVGVVIRLALQFRLEFFRLETFRPEFVEVVKRPVPLPDRKGASDSLGDELFGLPYSILGL